MITKKEIGKIIQNCRKKCGLTQDVLAEKVDISTNYLSKIERGINILNAETFLKMAEILSFSLEDFGVEVKSDDSNQEQQELLTKILSAPSDRARLYLKTLNFLDENILGR